MSHEIAIYATPIKASPAQPSLGKLRKKTPSPTKQALEPLTPVKPQKVPKLQLSLGAPAMVLASLAQASQDQPRQFPLEICLDFELFNGVDEPSMGSTAQHKAIMALFPHCVGVGVSPPFVHLQFSTLPPKPWPVKIAGLLACFAPHTMEALNSFPPSLRGQVGRGSSLEIEGDLPRWKVPTTRTLQTAIEELNTRGFKTSGVQWWGWCLVAEISELESDGFQARFPKQINGLQARYMFGSSFSPESARRVVQPTEASPDNEMYHGHLRPGVMLTGTTTDRSVLSTTSGVCVEDAAGKKFITCASHGFLPGNGNVHHPTLQGPMIGAIARTFESTDISLIELKPGFKYLRETFSEDDSPAVPFRNFRSPTTLRIADLVCMNTPFNGLCEGSFVATHVGRIPSDEPGREHRYFRSNMLYFGQTLEKIMDGCCGATLWTEGYDAIGQFRFVEEKNGTIAWAPAYDILAEQGYKLSEVA